MKLYFECEESTYAFEMADVEKLPVTIDTTSRVKVDNPDNLTSVTVYGSDASALQSVVDKFASDKNAEEIHAVNEYIAAGDYFRARMRNKWSGNVTESMTEPGVFTLSVSSKLVENDLLSDDFVGSVFKADLAYLFDYGLRVAKKQEKTVSGNKWKKAIRAFYAGKTADELRSATKDDYDGTKWDTDNHWKNFSITDKRMELLRGCYPTQHTLASDTLRTGKNLKRFVNVLLDTDEGIARADTKKGK